MTVAPPIRTRNRPKEHAPPRNVRFQISFADAKNTSSYQLDSTHSRPSLASSATSEKPRPACSKSRTRVPLSLVGITLGYQRHRCSLGSLLIIIHVAADQCRRPAHSPPDDCCSEHCLAILQSMCCQPLVMTAHSLAEPLALGDFGERGGEIMFCGTSTSWRLECHGGRCRCPTI